MRAFLRFTVWLAIIIGSAIGLARATAIQWWMVPLDDPWLGASVAPSLAPGDWVILWRLTRPTDGDLVKCPEPNAPERVVIGRILGSDNDQLEFEQGSVKLSGHNLRTERGCPQFEVAHPKTGEPVQQDCGVEDLDGRLYLRGNLVRDLPPPPSTGKLNVGTGKSFLVSDNRQFPFDSRDYGPVDASSCKESIVFRLWGKNGYFDQSRRFDVVR
jgi:signal peptidase I